MIKFSIENIPLEGIYIEGEESNQLLDFSDPAYEVISNISYDFKVTPMMSDILVQGDASVKIKGVCGRCLKEIEQTIEAEEVCHFYENPSTSELDITNEIREDIIISLPANIICDESCKGICQKCKANLNIESCNCAPPPKEKSVWDELDNFNIDK